jgi:hypothetical protein
MDTDLNSSRQWGYEIKVEGPLDKRWSDWFDGLEISCETAGGAKFAVTTLTALAIDQAALRGILTKLWNLNLDLISVVRLEQK